MVRALLGCLAMASRASLVVQFPPVTSIVTPVTKSASLDARKQITLAWSGASATRRNGVRSISACWSSGLDWFQRGLMRSVKVRLGAIALVLVPQGARSEGSFWGEVGWP